MRNPFRSEAEAYRLVLITVATFGITVVVAVTAGTWPGVGVFLFLAAVVSWWYLTSGTGERPPQAAPPGRHPQEERRILVVANETVGGEGLRECIREKTGGYDRARVRVVAPALNSPVRHWASDEDPARRAAQERLDRSLARLREAGIDAEGSVGDAEPLQAIEDGLRTFDPDEVIVSTHPEGRSQWLERGLVEAARERFAVPITHVVVDLDREEVR